MSKQNYLLSILLILMSIPLDVLCVDSRFIHLEKDQIVIVLSADEEGPVKIAVEALKKDFQKVMGFTPQVINKIGSNHAITQIVVVNRSSGATKAALDSRNPD